MRTFIVTIRAAGALIYIQTPARSRAQAATKASRARGVPAQWVVHVEEVSL